MAPLLLLPLLLAAPAEATEEARTPICCLPHPQIWLEQQTDEWRRARRARLLEPYGWLSLVGLHWLDGDGPWRIGRAEGEIRLGRGPDRLGILLREEAAGGATFFLVEEGRRHRLGVDLRGEPEGVADLEGGLRLAVIRRGQRFALRVWDPEAPSRRHFGELEYFPVSLHWVIEGRFVPHEGEKTLAIADVTGQETPRRNPGRVEFRIGDRSYALEALQENPEEELFFVFADRTNGRETYGGGRFLYARPPDPRGRVVLDFNRAYNPPCAFTPYSTCPLPPPENRLDLAVEAGEKRYRGAPEELSGP